MKTTCFIVAASLASLVLHAETTYYVSAETGSDENDGLSWETATASIQKAIDISSAGDSIVVMDGEYAPLAFSNRTITSVNGPDVTAIDGRGSQRCVTGGGTNTSTIVGFTVRNGHSTNGSGLFKTTAIGCIVSNNIYKTYSAGGVTGTYVRVWVTKEEE